MVQNELTHWGVKGQKWGVRRYRNKDGTLTERGKKRYDRDIRENNAKKKDNRINIDGPDADRWVKEDLERARRITNSSSDAVKELQRANNVKRSSKERMDLSNMSDQELRNRINRERLEREYNDMFAPQKVDKGRDYINKTLEVAGTVLAIGSSALGIALAIKELKG